MYTGYGKDMRYGECVLPGRQGCVESHVGKVYLVVKKTQGTQMRALLLWIG